VQSILSTIRADGQCFPARLAGPGSQPGKLKMEQVKAVMPADSD